MNLTNCNVTNNNKKWYNILTNNGKQMCLIKADMKMIQCSRIKDKGFNVLTYMFHSDCDGFNTYLHQKNDFDVDNNKYIVYLP